MDDHTPHLLSPDNAQTPHLLVGDDIVEDLLAFAEIINKSKGIACVQMLDGSIFEEAAQEIQRLRVERDGWQAEAAGLYVDISNAEDEKLSGKERLRRRPLGIVSERRRAEQLRDALGRLGLLPEEQVWDE